MNLRFEWDESKAASNLKKHKVSFDEASTVFSDPLAAIFDDEEHSSPQEQRELIIGTSVKKRLLVTSFTERRSEVVRIISSRPATKHEQADYEENIWRFKT